MCIHTYTHTHTHIERDRERGKRAEKERIRRHHVGKIVKTKQNLNKWKDKTFKQQQTMKRKKGIKI